MSRDMSFSIFMGLLLVNGSGIGIALRHLRRERQTSSSARPSLLRVLKPPGSIRSRRAPGRGAFAAGRKPGAYRLCACRATRISGARARPRVTKSRDTLRRKRMGSTAADDSSEEKAIQWRPASRNDDMEGCPSFEDRVALVDLRIQTARCARRGGIEEEAQ